MITNDSNFRPLQPRRLVSATAEVTLDGPGTRFTAGQLVVESADTRSGSVLQLAARRR